MNEFSKQCFARCKALFSPYGFKRHGKAFVRLVNDVYQSFDLEKLGIYSYGAGMQNWVRRSSPLLQDRRQALVK